ncbi:MAG: isoleucine--tRNA ligase [Clostridia bacterium]|nr:isoleucine--tRNA ligase [Clostridia bacterium]
MSEEKKDYGKTLNLPQTDFPMRGNLPENEPKIFEEVFENDLYEKMLKKNEGKTPFVLHDGPPYANGDLHMGHALNKVLKDTIVRYKNLRGYYTPFIPGFDTHGMPTERKAIEKLGLNREETPVTEFRDACKSFNKEYIKLQTNSFRRLGVLADWNNPYITYQPRVEAEQLKVFGTMYKKGYIYQGLKPVYWCTDCETALAEAEIEYKDVDSETVYVKFPVIEGSGLFDERDTFFVIWTTTPWTLPGNTGITLNPDFKYSLVDANGEKLVMATELVDKVMAEAEIKDYTTIKEFKGKELEGVRCKHPFLPRESKVVMGSRDTIDVDLETGTGMVHTAPGYGKEDYACGLKNGLDMIVCVDDKGHQTEEAGPFDGMFYAKSNKEITKWLDEHDLLLASKKVNHSYPHCWRCKKPIIFRATKQWFASIDKFRKDSLDEIKNVRWIPGWGEDRITKMIEERNDWCISRQRTWGVPLPIFYCEKCNAPHVTDESMAKVIDLVREKGTNCWFELDVKDLIEDGAKCEKCGGTEFRKETDIMDVWFDSGSTHQSVVKERGLPVADLYLEGADQYRGWFQSSLLTAIAVTGKAPYKEVLTHGWTVDAQGRQMHKSLGNGIDPQDIVKEYGADILRLWALSSDYQSDVRVSKEILKQVSEVYRKIRNTARYILGNTSDFDVNKPVAYEDLLEIDKWALTRLNKLIVECTKAYDAYEFNRAYQAINTFCVVDMSNFYLDIIKDRLYTAKTDSVERRAAQTAMYEILNSLVRILAPMTAFTAEEIWKFMKHKDGENAESVMLAFYPEVNPKFDNKELEAKWDKILKLKEDVAKVLEEARAAKILGHSLNAKVVLSAEGDDFKFLNDNKDLLMTVFIVSGLEIVQGKANIKVEVAEGEKCERCWMYSPTVGLNPEHPTICKRCSEALK